VRAIFDPGEIAGCPSADADRSGDVGAADLVRIALALAPAAEGCAAAPASQWVERAPLPDEGRQEVGAALLDGAIYVIGGFDERRAGSARVDAYDVARDEWIRVADLPSARNHIGAAAVAGRVYAIGGFVGSSFSAGAAVDRYDPATGEWSAAASLPMPRGALAAVALDGKIYATGGARGGVSVSDHAVYDPAANEWTALAPLPTQRNHLAAAVIGRHVYVVGGRREGAPDTGELDRYDPQADAWETLAPMPTARSGIGAAVSNGRLIVLGGEVNSAHPNGVFPEVEIYDPALDAWTSLDPMPVPRHGIWAVAVGNRIDMAGGATMAGFAASRHHDVLEIAW
jgi:N-acetylneuraminic acid mutarotase